MRICIVTQYFWPEEFRINDLVQALVGRGHSVQVLTGQPNYPGGTILREFRSHLPKWSEIFGAPVLRVPIIARGKGSGLHLGANYLSFAASASLHGVARMHKPVDVVLAYEPSPVTVALPALALGKRFRAPVLMWIQDLWPETLRATGVLPDGLALNAAGWLTGMIHRAMDGLLVQSRAFSPMLERQGVASTKITYLPNWAEDYFQPISVPSTAPERGELPEGFVVLFAGNLGVAQGLEVVLGAAERLRDIKDLHWVFLGDGRQAASLHKEVERRHLGNVHFMGSRASEAMPTWFALADALLVTLRPDPLYGLTIPSKVQAYMACGRPILASLDGLGANELEEAGAGLTARAGDAQSLAAITRQLYSMAPQDRAAIGRRGRAHYDANFNREVLVGRVEMLLDRAIANRSTR